jgi:hypothetical protein
MHHDNKNDLFDLLSTSALRRLVFFFFVYQSFLSRRSIYSQHDASGSYVLFRKARMFNGMAAPPPPAGMTSPMGGKVSFPCASLSYQ